MHAQAYLFEAWQRGHSHAQESGLDPESAAWVAEAGGRAVLNELLPRYEAVEEQERANWTYIRQLRAANERLRDTLTQIAALSPGPASDLAIAALEAAPATRSRADDEIVGDPAPLAHWATLTPRHRNGSWYLAAHVDRPNDQVVVRWASIPLDPDRPWEGSGGGLDYPADAFTHVIPRPQGPGQGETIELAAIQHRGLAWAVPRPGRHGDVVRCLADTHPDEGPFVGEQGFLTSTGRFVDRITAGEIALKADQTKALKWGRELFSEDLW